jgi:hypothetical protein
MEREACTKDNIMSTNSSAVGGGEYTRDIEGETS